jgi:hypothetical protein
VQQEEATRQSIAASWQIYLEFPAETAQKHFARERFNGGVALNLQVLPAEKR